MHVNKESDVIFNGVTFTDPTNKSSNATSVYASGFDSKIVFEGCTFKDLQWEAIQITPLAGAEIVVSNCYFSNSKTMAESGVQQNRYVQIEVTDTSADISKIKATITNNIFENVVQSAFGGNGYFKDSAVTVYGVPHSNITLGGNVFCGVVAADALNNPNYLWISDGRSEKLRYDGFSVAENVNSSDDFSAAVADGKPVYMTGNITLPEQLETAGDITVIGNGNELASPAGATRIVNVTGEVCDNVTLNFKDVKLVGPTSGTYTRGISIYDSENVTVNIEDCELSANYYAFNIASASNNTVLNIKDSVVTGWAAFQTHSPYSKVTFENCTLIGLNDKGYNAEGWNDFATIVINGFTEGNPDLQGAHDGEFVFKNCRIEANQTTGNNQYFLSVRAANTTVMVENCTFFKDGVQIPTSELNNEKYISVYPEVYDTFKYIIK